MRPKKHTRGGSNSKSKNDRKSKGDSSATAEEFRSNTTRRPMMKIMKRKKFSRIKFTSMLALLLLLIASSMGTATELEEAAPAAASVLNGSNNKNVQTPSQQSQIERGKKSYHITTIIDTLTARSDDTEKQRLKQSENKEEFHRRMIKSNDGRNGDSLFINKPKRNFSPLIAKPTSSSSVVLVDPDKQQEEEEKEQQAENQALVVSSSNIETQEPSKKPTPGPTLRRTTNPTPKPTPKPTMKPTISPTQKPTPLPTPELALRATPRPTPNPTLSPTSKPIQIPSSAPSFKPTFHPSELPSVTPSTSNPTSSNPTPNPSFHQTLSNPTSYPSDFPSISPTLAEEEEGFITEEDETSIFVVTVEPVVLVDESHTLTEAVALPIPFVPEQQQQPSLPSVPIEFYNDEEDPPQQQSGSGTGGFLPLPFAKELHEKEQQKQGEEEEVMTDNLKEITVPISESPASSSAENKLNTTSTTSTTSVVIVTSGNNMVKHEEEEKNPNKTTAVPLPPRSSPSSDVTHTSEEGTFVVNFGQNGINENENVLISSRTSIRPFGLDFSPTNSDTFNRATLLYLRDVTSNYLTDKIRIITGEGEHKEADKGGEVGEGRLVVVSLEVEAERYIPSPKRANMRQLQIRGTSRSTGGGERAALPLVEVGVGGGTGGKTRVILNGQVIVSVASPPPKQDGNAAQGNGNGNGDAMRRRLQETRDEEPELAANVAKIFAENPTIGDDVLYLMQNDPERSSEFPNLQSIQTVSYLPPQTAEKELSNIIRGGMTSDIHDIGTEEIGSPEIAFHPPHSPPQLSPVGSVAPSDEESTTSGDKSGGAFGKTFGTIVAMSFVLGVGFLVYTKNKVRARKDTDYSSDDSSIEDDFPSEDGCNMERGGVDDDENDYVDVVSASRGIGSRSLSHKVITGLCRRANVHPTTTRDDDDTDDDEDNDNDASSGVGSDCSTGEVSTFEVSRTPLSYYIPKNFFKRRRRKPREAESLTAPTDSVQFVTGQRDIRGSEQRHDSSPKATENKGRSMTVAATAYSRRKHSLLNPATKQTCNIGKRRKKSKKRRLPGSNGAGPHQFFKARSSNMVMSNSPSLLLEDGSDTSPDGSPKDGAHAILETIRECDIESLSAATSCSAATFGTIDENDAKLGKVVGGASSPVTLPILPAVGTDDDRDGEMNYNHDDHDVAELGVEILRRSNHDVEIVVVDNKGSSGNSSNSTSTNTEERENDENESKECEPGGKDKGKGKQNMADEDNHSSALPIPTKKEEGRSPVSTQCSSDGGERDTVDMRQEEGGDFVDNEEQKSCFHEIDDKKSDNFEDHIAKNETDKAEVEEWKSNASYNDGQHQHKHKKGDGKQVIDGGENKDELNKCISPSIIGTSKEPSHSTPTTKDKAEEEDKDEGKHATTTKLRNRDDENAALMNAPNTAVPPAVAAFKELQAHEQGEEEESTHPQQHVEPNDQQSDKNDEQQQQQGKEDREEDNNEMEKGGRRPSFTSSSNSVKNFLSIMDRIIYSHKGGKGTEGVEGDGGEKREEEREHEYGDEQKRVQRVFAPSPTTTKSLSDIDDDDDESVSADIIMMQDYDKMTLSSRKDDPPTTPIATRCHSSLLLKKISKNISSSSTNTNTTMDSNRDDSASSLSSPFCNDDSGGIVGLVTETDDKSENSSVVLMDALD